MNDKDVRDIELDLLLDAILRGRGYDFRGYARASLRRRVAATVSGLGLEHTGELIAPVLRNDLVFERFLRDLSVSVTEMFRDPQFYVSLREKVIPHLKTYPHIKVWHAGCSTGEEVYSMAILLHEAGLYHRTQIYATDFNNESLDRAREGIYPLRKMKAFTEAYNATAPKGSFSDYYHAKYDSARMSEALRKQITFANHNLVIDGIFGEMNLVICRNVLIYFNKDLQNRVLSLLRDSLCYRGFLCLGTKETIDFSAVAEDFDTEVKEYRIYRKRRYVMNSNNAGGTPSCTTQW